MVWAGVGLGAGLGTLRKANPDARLLVAALVVVCPLAAVGAAFLLGRRDYRAAGAGLLVSATMPSSAIYPISAIALLLGLGLIFAPSWMLGPPT